MRVTNKMLSNNFLRDMNVNLQNMSKLQQQMSSGKEISKPSDDPFKVARVMQLQSDINANKQYNVNIQNATSTLDTTDTVLGQAGDVMKRLNELLISAGNPNYGVDQKKAIKDEVNQKISEFSQILNTNFDGKYLFGGTRSTTKPMDTVEMVSATDPTIKNTRLIYYKTDGTEIVTNPAIITNAADAITAATNSNEYKQITSKINVEISQGVTVDYNVCASEIIQFPKSDGTLGDLKTLFSKMINHLDGNDDTGAVPDATATGKLITTDLQGIKDAMNNLLALRADVGAKENRMDSAKANNEDQTYNMTDILSKTEDIDITKKTMEYSIMQTVYMASLQTSAKVIQPSLLDYLR